MYTISLPSVFHPQSPQQYQNQISNSTEIYTEDLCKFCFQTERQSQEKLISPCGCSGSLKYVHKQCLQKWLAVEADRKESPLADISFKLRIPNLKCKLCSKDIIFEKEIKVLNHVIVLFHWITILCFIKKLKYYACISILGSFAINYYFLRYFFEKLYKVSLKIKDHSLILLVVLSLVLVVLEQTFVEVKWNKNSMEFSIPFLNNK